MSSTTDFGVHGSYICSSGKHLRAEDRAQSLARHEAVGGDDDYADGSGQVHEEVILIDARRI